MNKRIKKKILKRGYCNTYKEYKSGNLYQMLNIKTNGKTRKIKALCEIQSNFSINKNGRHYDLNLIKKEIDNLLNKNMNLSNLYY